jgi:hypothetical protein
MRRETKAKARPKAAAMASTPLWSVGVMTLNGADCPGSKVGPGAAVPEAVGSITVYPYLGTDWRPKTRQWEKRGKGKKLEELKLQMPSSSNIKMKCRKEFKWYIPRRAKTSSQQENQTRKSKSQGSRTGPV